MEDDNSNVLRDQETLPVKIRFKTGALLSRAKFLVTNDYQETLPVKIRFKTHRFNFYE